MAKVIKYFLPGKTQQILHKVVMEWSETNEEVAKAEAANGEYTIEDDTTSRRETP